MPRRSRHSCRPEVARLESRDVPTVVSPLAFGGAGLAAQHADSGANAKLIGVAAALPGQTPGAGSSSSAAPIGLNFNPNATLDPSILTPRGQAAAQFSSLVNGPYALSRSYYTGVAKDMVFIGNVRGTTNQMLHGTLLMEVEVPTDPSSGIYGIAVLRDLSNATTGTQLVLDLTATATDSQGRPTQFTWTVDASSSGSYTNSPGQGTLSVAYTANGHSRYAVGGDTLVFKGLVLPNPVQLNVLYDIPKFG